MHVTQQLSAAATFPQTPSELLRPLVHSVTPSLRSLVESISSNEPSEGRSLWEGTFHTGTVWNGELLGVSLRYTLLRVYS